MVANLTLKNGHVDFEYKLKNDQTDKVNWMKISSLILCKLNPSYCHITQKAQMVNKP
jgi:hypothetical protein